MLLVKTPEVRFQGGVSSGDPGRLPAREGAHVRNCTRHASGQEGERPQGPGRQGNVLAAALAVQRGPVTILNGDLPCITSSEIAQLTAAAPAIVAAADATTNAIALRDAADFTPLYGPGSAARFEAALGAARLDLPGLRDDVDTWDDLQSVRDRVGDNTRAYLDNR